MRQGESKIPNTNGGKLLRRPSTSYKKLLDRVTFGIIYIALVKSQSARGTSHQSVFMDSCLAIINRTYLAYLPSR